MARMTAKTAHQSGWMSREYMGKKYLSDDLVA